MKEIQQELNYQGYEITPTDLWFCQRFENLYPDTNYINFEELRKINIGQIFYVNNDSKNELNLELYQNKIKEI